MQFFLEMIAMKIASGLIILAGLIAPSIFGASPTPGTPALIDTYLATDISKTATTMTLANGTYRDGTALSGFLCFTLDVNTPSVEYVCGTASSTSVTDLTRGISYSNPNATSSANTFVHRRLASVIVTDYPASEFVRRKIEGLDELTQPLFYANGAPEEFTSNPQLVSKEYVDTLAFGSSTWWIPSGNNIYNSNSQSVIIGTSTNPGTGIKLDVVASDDNSTYLRVKNRNAGSLTSTGISLFNDVGETLLFRPSSGYVVPAIANVTVLDTGSASAGSDFILRNSAVDSTARIYVASTTGNVGVGTTTPSVKLEVAGGIKGTSLSVNGTSNFAATSTNEGKVILASSTPTDENEATRKNYVDLRILDVAASSTWYTLTSGQDYHATSTAGFVTAWCTASGGIGSGCALTVKVGPSTSTYYTVHNQAGGTGGSGGNEATDGSAMVPKGYWFQINGSGGTFQPFSY